MTVGPYEERVLLGLICFGKLTKHLLTNKNLKLWKSDEIQRKKSEHQGCDNTWHWLLNDSVKAVHKWQYFDSDLILSEKD